MKLWRSVLGLVFGTGALLGPAVAAAHSGHTMQEPWQVCEDATLSDACAWTNDAGDLYVGTCREVSDTLLCVRNKPIVKHGAHEHEHGVAHEHETPGHGDHEGSPPPLEAAETLVTDVECPNAGPSPLLIGGVGLFGVGLFGLLGLWGWSRERRASSTLVAALGLLSVTGNSGCRGIEEPAAQQPGVETPVAEAGLDATAFATAPTQTESCTLSNGEQAQCYRFEVQTTPADHDAGPFCPRTIDDGPELVGTWIHEGKVLDVDGAFITGLAELYGDPEWKLFDETTRKVRVTDTKESCAAAARPDVEEAYQNHCVECSVDDIGEEVAETILIPARPVPRAQPAELGRGGSVGIALNGVKFEGPAPVHAILAAHTIAAFDDCGGHVNLHVGYHYHGAQGCSKSRLEADGHAALIGYAVDGYPIHAMTDAQGREADELDVCRGHDDATRGYHYHVAGPGENMFVGCLKGEVAQGANARGPGGGPPPPGGGRGPAGAAGGVAACADVSSTRCCGDGVCDGPETAETCATDCAAK